MRRVLLSGAVVITAVALFPFAVHAQQPSAVRTSSQTKTNFGPSTGTLTSSADRQKKEQQAILAKEKIEEDAVQNMVRGEQMAQDRMAAEVKEEVTLEQILLSFEKSSEAWTLIIDKEAKEMVISAYIERYRGEGITISKSSVFYTEIIDAMAQQDVMMLQQPMKDVLAVLAIMEYDFDNGQDKDALALKVLGSREAVMENRKRLGY